MNELELPTTQSEVIDAEVRETGWWNAARVDWQGWLSSKLVLALGLAVLLLAGSGLFLVKTYWAVEAEFVAVDHRVDEPFVVYLNQRLAWVEVGEIDIAPEVEGAWIFEPGDLLKGDRLVFKQEELFRVNTTYTVT